jgi:16S rRNA (cytidine1402-2'-O)-methyltransferase
MGILYIVGTPIGNLEDLSPRAMRTLSEADLIAAEDTRVTRGLLSHFGIRTPLVTYTDAHAHQKASRLARVMAALAAEQRVALVSDAGMPGLADPGYELVTAALDAGHQVVVIPGPSAITAALVAAGLPVDRFTFVGYLPRKAAARKALLAELADEPGAIVAFETPHRLNEALADLLAVFGDRPMAIARELTKLFEEVWRGAAAEALAHFQQQPARGELTLVIAGTGRARGRELWPRTRVVEAIALLQEEGLAAASVARIVARLSGWQRAEVYAMAVQNVAPESAAPTVGKP